MKCEMKSHHLGSHKDHYISRRTFLLGLGASLIVGSSGFPKLVKAQSRVTKVGIALPEHGPFSQDARSLIAGFDCYLKEHGVSRIKAVRRDPGANDERTIQVLTELLMTDKVDFLISPMSLDGAEKAVHAVSGSSAVLFVMNPCVKLVAGELCQSRSFRVGPNTYQRCYPLSPWVIQNLGQRAFITGSNDREGNETADFFAYSFDKSGGTFGDRVMLPPDSNNVHAITDVIDKTKSDFIFAAFSKRDALGFLRAIDSGKYRRWLKCTVGPNSLVTYPAGAHALGKIVSGLRTLSCVKDPLDFLQRLKKSTRTDVSDVGVAAEGYDIANVIDLCTNNVSWENDNTSALIEFMENLSINGPRGVLKFDKNHEPILDMVIQEWQFSNSQPHPKLLQEVPGVLSLDFGCGKVGFPQRPRGDVTDEGPLWEDIEE